ncbi:hypothetical protein BRD08_02520 [Halobacteriales archaeon SW_10_66_29]|nr:MAG: hypothetical protein BRC73_04230 [Halobacteriales archaeon QH_7_66_37]PSQ37548.1 MAG: hypothetical protein BRD08_02520 [Halobacteriales archaeon SW_10_66_29]
MHSYFLDANQEPNMPDQMPISASDVTEKSMGNEPRPMEGHPGCRRPLLVSSVPPGKDSLLWFLEFTIVVWPGSPLDRRKD